MTALTFPGRVDKMFYLLNKRVRMIRESRSCSNIRERNERKEVYEHKSEI